MDRVTPDWLTRALTRSGALTGGQVVSCAIDARDRILSTSYRIRIAYSEGSTGDMPRRLFLKTVNADQEDEFFGSSEIDYYVRDYAGVDCAPLVRCYDGAFSAEQRRYHLLLDDLSDSHVEAKTKTPTLEYGLALAEALACLHAHWWGAGRIAESGDRLPSAGQINRFVEIAAPGAGHIIREFGDRLKPHWPQTMVELIERHPRAMTARTRDGNGFALIHGDVNRTNILVPREGVRPLYIIDRQPFDWSLTVWLAAYDLAYAVVLDWEIEVRRRHEMAILRHYYDHLIARGVRDYAWERLVDDYRLSAAICVYVAIEWCRGGINREWTHIWLPKLQNSLTACDDLNCRELWMGY
jgi:hypothetical protein